MAYTISFTLEFAGWLAELADEKAKGLITQRLRRAEEGHFGDVERVGDGVSEMRIHYGPGYRLYFTMRGRVVIVMLCGGDKGSQRRDIARAKSIRDGL